VSRANVVECALAASAVMRAEREAVAAARGREKTASSVLPSNPLVQFSGGRRNGPDQSATNWYGTLSQEFEIAGQRRARGHATESDRRAQESTAQVVERDVAAQALRAYFGVLAAREVFRVAEHLEQAFASATQAAKASAERGVSAGIDADLADISAVRLTQVRLAAQRRHAAALAELETLLGVDPTGQLEVDGDLTPLPRADGSDQELVQEALKTRPELAAADATERSYTAWSESYRRARVPNLTVSLIAQRDGFDERVLGAGVSLPITLPAPIGRNYAGQVAENAALARRSAALRDQTERDIRLQLFNARQALETARAELALFTEDRLKRAEQTLDAIAREIAAGRLAISGMIVAQQSFIEFLNQHVEAQLSVCLASVDLVHAAGLSLAGGVP
jgi:cobalt-zinc-cadmium efflux system outer membrane protein